MITFGLSCIPHSQSQSLWGALSDDVCHKVFEGMSRITLGHATRTCRSWHLLALAESLRSRSLRFPLTIDRPLSFANLLEMAYSQRNALLDSACPQHAALPQKGETSKSLSQFRTWVKSSSPPPDDLACWQAHQIICQTDNQRFKTICLLAKNHFFLHAETQSVAIANPDLQGLAHLRLFKEFVFANRIDEGMTYYHLLPEDVRNDLAFDVIMKLITTHQFSLATECLDRFTFSIAQREELHFKLAQKGAEMGEKRLVLETVEKLLKAESLPRLFTTLCNVYQH
ncbi:MAG: hypothetical protein S4CHLAM102_08410 [Chlamydiia bacterium]|nr:hypothetical protein [Chlamydiia bacterium]